MARLRVGSPFGVLGAGAGGLAEGLYMGQDLAQRRASASQDEQRQKLAAAMQLLGLGAKSEDPQFIESINAMLGQVAPQMPHVPVPDPNREMQRAKLKVDALIAQNPDMEPHRANLMQQMLGLTPAKEVQPKISPELAALGQALGKNPDVGKWTQKDWQDTIQADYMHRQKLAEASAQGRVTVVGMPSHGGGGGMGGQVYWVKPDGTPIGYNPKGGGPPTPDAIPLELYRVQQGQGGGQTESQYSLDDLQKINKATKAIKQGSATEDDVALVESVGGQVKREATPPTTIGGFQLIGPGEKVSLVTEPPKTKKTVRRKGSAPATAPPVPPPSGFVED